MVKTRTIYGVLLLGLVFTVVFGLMMKSNAWSKKTPDGGTPAVEMVCDGLLIGFGLCNAYCEAKDCDMLFPDSTNTCDEMLSNYQDQTGFPGPPCVCGLICNERAGPCFGQCSDEAEDCNQLCGTDEFCHILCDLEEFDCEDSCTDDLLKPCLDRCADQLGV